MSRSLRHSGPDMNPIDAATHDVRRSESQLPSTSSTGTSIPLTGLDSFSYDDDIVRKFMLATFVWGVVGMLVGLLIALQLAVPTLNLAPYLTFGRLRPLHTNAVIFAFAGNAFFAGVLLLDAAALQGADVLRLPRAASTSGAGRRSSSPPRSRCRSASRRRKEYAELEWPIDIAIAVVWVVFAINFFGTLARRRERHLYVALWFYIATIVTVAILHIFNNLVAARRRPSRATRSTPACRTRSCSGGTATTPSRSSSPRRSSA